MKITRRHLLTFLDSVFRVVLGGVFIYAAWTKILDPALFAEAVDSYAMLPAPLVAIVAIVLPPAELLAGLALILTRWQREAALLILGMLAIFFIGLVQAQIRGLEIGCGCFGGEEGDTVMDAIVRDIFLLVPAIWLVVRQNRPAWSWKVILPASALIVTALAYITLHPETEAPPDLSSGEEFAPKTPHEAVSEVFARFPHPDTNAVAVEVWTEDFPAALARAHYEKRPLMIAFGAESCIHCKRLKTAMENPGFLKWLNGTGMYLATATIASTNRPPVPDAMYRFLKSAAGTTPIHSYPFVGIYWEKPSGETIWTAFTGRHRQMPGKHNRALFCELANTVGGFLSEYMATRPPRPDEGEMLAMTAKRISVAREGEGQVSMTPAHGTLIDDGSKVVLAAKPAKGWRFLGWRVPGTSNSTRGGIRHYISYDKPEGTYTAVFKPLRPRPASSRRDQDGQTTPINPLTAPSKEQP